MIVLAHRDEIYMLCVEQSAYIGGRRAECVVCGDGEQHRSPFLICDFAARVTGVSFIPFASFARVFLYTAQ